MAKLPRVKQEIFGEQAGSRQITAFGTAKTDNPVYTTNIAQIQNSNFLQGWLSALLPDKAPYEEDMNALFYAITSQLAYLFQEGFPEYDLNTEYNIGSLVKSIDTQGNITIYKSLTDNNIGNTLTDNNYWAVFQSDSILASASYEIGLPQPTFSNTLLDNEIWLEGQTVSRNTYANLFKIYGTTYGAGNGSTTFKLPDCRNRVLWGASSFGYINAGLPNITGNFILGGDDATHPQQASSFANGAFSFTGTSTGRTFENTGGGQTRIDGINFNASRLSNVYGGSSTVQPPAIKCRVKTRYK